MKNTILPSLGPPMSETILHLYAPFAYGLPFTGTFLTQCADLDILLPTRQSSVLLQISFKTHRNYETPGPLCTAIRVHRFVPLGWHKLMIYNLCRHPQLCLATADHDLKLRAGLAKSCLALYKRPATVHFSHLVNTVMAADRRSCPSMHSA